MAARRREGRRRRRQEAEGRQAAKGQGRLARAKPESPAATVCGEGGSNHPNGGGRQANFRPAGAALAALLAAYEAAAAVAGDAGPKLEAPALEAL